MTCVLKFNGLNDENFELRTSVDGSTSVSSIDFTSLIQATDADGDTSTATVSITVTAIDDVPVAVADTLADLVLRPH